MIDVIAVRGAGDQGNAVVRVSEALAGCLGTHTCPGSSEHAEEWPANAVAVVGRSDPDAPWLHLARSVRQPIVVTPSGVPEDFEVRRVLLPLDGTAEAAHAVETAVALLSGAGLELVALHVFEAGNVPPFWDQVGHEEDAWEQEFQSRFLPGQDIRVVARSGVPGALVADVAADEGADLIVLGWSARPVGGRARTVRSTVETTRVPVMLVPLPRPDGTIGPSGTDQRGAQ
ncbi:universal stress protein [Terrabacter sp. MAHUQ-38]|uniref:universal stress protein n=1 Tax=unclassified Terrabacter TaxID=2630222 RepID=UPI00165D41EE|nr:universal stress protein [Terrabacter sp. MAHUQ-38]MBC9821215.1 universal stress protein [Terrabacter sp. MAHUQ-38]